MFWRKPIIYDLWGDIRAYWALAEWYECRAILMANLKTDFIGTMKKLPELAGKTSQLYRYEMNAR